MLLLLLLLLMLMMMMLLACLQSPTTYLEPSMLFRASAPQLSSWGREMSLVSDSQAATCVFDVFPVGSMLSNCSPLYSAMLGVSCVRIRLNCRRLFTKTTAAAPCQQLIKYLVRARALCLSRMLGIATRLSCTCCIRLCPSRASEPAAPHLGRDQGDAHCSRTCPFQRVKCWSLRCTLSLTHRLHRLAALLPSINRYRYQNTTLSFCLPALSLSLFVVRTRLVCNFLLFARVA